MEFLAIMAVVVGINAAVLGCVYWLQSRSAAPPEPGFDLNGDRFQVTLDRLSSLEGKVANLDFKVEQLPPIWEDHVDRVKKHANRAVAAAKRSSGNGDQEPELSAVDDGDGNDQSVLPLREDMGLSPEVEEQLRRQIALGQ